MPNIIQGINIDNTEGQDKITSTDKITAGYFSNGNGSLLAADIWSGSLANSNENYYFNILDNIFRIRYSKYCFIT